VSGLDVDVLSKLTKDVRMMSSHCSNRKAASYLIHLSAPFSLVHVEASANKLRRSPFLRLIDSATVTYLSHNCHAGSVSTLLSYLPRRNRTASFYRTYPTAIKSYPIDSAGARLSDLRYLRDDYVLRLYGHRTVRFL
jgi:hypothetical protein